MAGRGTDIKLGGERKYDEHFEALLQEEDINENEKHQILEIKDLIDRLKLDDAKSRSESLSLTAKKGLLKIIDLAYDWIDENKRVKELGGLYILGTERHEARRIDNQLRGRSGRQGDPGESRFYISMDDDLMRLFGGDRLQKMLSGIGMKEGELIEHPWITSRIEKAQKKVETRNFEIRKHLLEYDDVLNKQRVFIYQKRDEILEDQSIIDRVYQSTKEILEDFIYEYQSNIKMGVDVAALEFTKQLKKIFYVEPVELIRKYQNDSKSLLEVVLNLLKEELYTKDKVLGHSI